MNICVIEVVETIVQVMPAVPKSRLQNHSDKGVSDCQDLSNTIIHTKILSNILNSYAVHCCGLQMAV